MNSVLEQEIETLITERLLAFYERLIERGQIGPPLDQAVGAASHPPSHCILSGHMPAGSSPTDHVPLQGDPVPLS